MKIEQRERIARIINILIVILEVAGMIIAIGNNGIGILGYYTQESNLLLLITTIIYLLAKDRLGDDIPYWIKAMKFVSTCLVTVTFAVVTFCFIPMCVPSMGWIGGAKAMLIDGANFSHHLICPLLALVVYMGFENDLKPGKKECLIATLPTLLYAVVATALNIAKVVRGPYPFLYVYEQPVIVSVIWFIAIPLGGWLFAKLIAYIKRKIHVND